MTRQQAIAKLERMIQTIEEGLTLVPIQALYVFGSFARGAVQPRDLDVIAIHSQPPRGVLTHLEAEHSRRTRTPQPGAGHQRLAVTIAGTLRRPGDPVDLIVEATLDNVLFWRRLDPGEVRLVWSADDRDWRRKVEQIQTDPSAGPAPVIGFINPGRYRCSRGEVERITRMIDRQQVTLHRVPLGSEPPGLEPRMRRTLDAYTRAGSFGARRLQTLPFALRWLQDHRVRQARRDTSDVHDSDGRYCVTLGETGLLGVLRALRRDRTRLVAWLPEFRTRYPRELFEFSRGPAWEGEAHGRPETRGAADAERRA